MNRPIYANVPTQYPGSPEHRSDLFDALFGYNNDQESTDIAAELRAISALIDPEYTTDMTDYDTWGNDVRAANDRQYHHLQRAYVMLQVIADRIDPTKE